MAAEEELIKDSDDNESDIASDKETEFLENSAEKRDVSGYFEDEATEDKNIDKKRKRVDSEEEENTAPTAPTAIAARDHMNVIEGVILNAIVA